MIRIKVPATSANLGVGFDCMGLAVSLYSVIDFEPSEQKLEIYGCPEKFQNMDNLVYRSFAKGCNYLGEDLPNVKISIKNAVPIARGLGSSSVCIVAGLKGASAWFNDAIPTEELVKLAVEMEGHPDNVTPAILGGLCVTFLDEQKQPVVTQYNVAKALNFVALIPDYEINTSLARKVLPETMTYATAIHQVSRCTVMTRALESGNDELIRQACDDWIHEPFRAKLIPDYKRAKIISEELSGTMYISGSGSTMMAITSDDNSAEAIIRNAKKTFPAWQVEKLSVDLAGARSEVIERGEILYR